MKRLFLLLCLLLSSCSNTTSLTPSNTFSERDSDGCIPPLVSFSFPYGDSGLPNPEDRKILLPDNWQPITSLEGSGSNSYDSSYEFQIIRSIDGHNELWVTDESKGDIYFFRTDIEEWVKVNNFLESFSHYFLFLDSGNNVWLTYRFEKTTPPSFWQYDNQKNTFILVFEDLSLSQLYTSSEVISHDIDRNGIFWTVLTVKSQDNPFGMDVLYKFDPLAKKGQIRYSFDQDNTPAIEINRAGNIFFVDINSSTLFEYYPDTQEVREYKIPVDISSNLWVELFYDDENRLWINDFGWFDFSIENINPQWFTVIRSPVFIYYLPPAGIWNWTSPQLILQDHQELIWFTSASGTGWVNAMEGKWCLLTTYTSNVISDSHHNLWILLDGTFYMKTSNS